MFGLVEFEVEGKKNDGQEVYRYQIILEGNELFTLFVLRYPDRDKPESVDIDPMEYLTKEELETYPFNSIAVGHLDSKKLTKIVGRLNKLK